MSAMIKEKKLSLIALMLAFLAGSALTGCSSSDESSSGGSSCADQCASQPDINQDECMVACEA